MNMSIIIVYSLVFVLSGFLVSKYLDIKDKKTKKIINIVIAVLVVVSIILMTIFLIYFFNLLSKAGSV